jgi:hypothetical protein
MVVTQLVLDIFNLLAASPTGKNNQFLCKDHTVREANACNLYYFNFNKYKLSFGLKVYILKQIDGSRFQIVHEQNVFQSKKRRNDCEEKKSPPQLLNTKNGENGR